MTSNRCPSKRRPRHHQNEETDMSIMLTETAAKEIRKIIDEQGKDGAFAPEKAKLRVGVKGGGCSGFSYTLDLVEEDKGETDEELEAHGVKILCDMKSLLY